MLLKMCGMHVKWQEREAARKRTKEVSYNMRERVRQELAVPSVVHFYTWLLRSAAHVARWFTTASCASPVLQASASADVC